MNYGNPELFFSGKYTHTHTHTTMIHECCYVLFIVYWERCSFSDIETTVINTRRNTMLFYSVFGMVL